MTTASFPSEPQNVFSSLNAWLDESVHLSLRLPDSITLLELAVAETFITSFYVSEIVKFP
jgi:hypothetical protein